jgi:hypothetical protein
MSPDGNGILFLFSQKKRKRYSVQLEIAPEKKSEKQFVFLLLLHSNKRV